MIKIIQDIPDIVGLNGKSILENDQTIKNLHEELLRLLITHEPLEKIEELVCFLLGYVFTQYSNDLVPLMKNVLSQHEYINSALLNGKSKDEAMWEASNRYNLTNIGAMPEDISFASKYYTKISKCREQDLASPIASLLIRMESILTASELHETEIKKNLNQLFRLIYSYRFFEFTNNINKIIQLLDNQSPATDEKINKIKDMLVGTLLLLLEQETPTTSELIDVIKKDENDFIGRFSIMVVYLELEDVNTIYNALKKYSQKGMDLFNTDFHELELIMKFSSRVKKVFETLIADSPSPIDEALLEPFLLNSESFIKKFSLLMIREKIYEHHDLYMRLLGIIKRGVHGFNIEYDNAFDERTFESNTEIITDQKDFINFLENCTAQELPDPKLTADVRGRPDNHYFEPSDSALYMPEHFITQSEIDSMTGLISTLFDSLFEDDTTPKEPLFLFAEKMDVFFIEKFSKMMIYASINQRCDILDQLKNTIILGFEFFDTHNKSIEKFIEFNEKIKSIFAYLMSIYYNNQESWKPFLNNNDFIKKISKIILFKNIIKNNDICNILLRFLDFGINAFDQEYISVSEKHGSEKTDAEAKLISTLYFLNSIDQNILTNINGNKYLSIVNKLSEIDVVSKNAIANKINDTIVFLKKYHPHIVSGFELSINEFIEILIQLDIDHKVFTDIMDRDDWCIRLDLVVNIKKRTLIQINTETIRFFSSIDDSAINEIAINFSEDKPYNEHKDNALSAYIKTFSDNEMLERDKLEKIDMYLKVINETIASQTEESDINPYIHAWNYYDKPTASKKPSEDTKTIVSRLFQDFFSSVYDVIHTEFAEDSVNFIAKFTNMISGNQYEESQINTTLIDTIKNGMHFFHEKYFSFTSEIITREIEKIGYDYDGTQENWAPFFGDLEFIHAFSKMMISENITKEFIPNILRKTLDDGIENFNKKNRHNQRAQMPAETHELPEYVPAQQFRGFGNGSYNLVIARADGQVDQKLSRTRRLKDSL